MQAGNRCIAASMPLAAKLHRSAISSTLQLPFRLLHTSFAACHPPQARPHFPGTLAHDEQPDVRYLETSETQPLERAMPSKRHHAGLESIQEGQAADPAQDVSAEQKLTHVDSSGKATMVGVGYKGSTKRFAAARAFVLLGPKAYAAVKLNNLRKGDVLGIARMAGIMGAKQASQLIPLCHNIPLDEVQVKVSLDPERPLIRIRGEVWCHGRTGVEMEAMTAVTTAALTVYDMCKSISKLVTIQGIALVKKSGGKSGDWVRRDDPTTPGPRPFE